MRRILHIVLDLEVGGLERVVADLIRDTDREKFELGVFFLAHPGRLAEGLASRATLQLVRPLPLVSLLWPRSLARAIARFSPDVVHSHSGVWQKASLAARLAHVPRTIHTDHGRRKFPDPPFDRLSDVWASRRTDVIVAVSEALKEYLIRRVAWYPERVSVIPNGVDTARFAPGPEDRALLASLGVPEGRPVIGTVGRFDVIKAYDVMVRAFAELLAAPPVGGGAPVLVVAGDGPEGDRLRGLAHELGIAEHVRFPGWVEDIPRLLRSFTVFTLSSHSEGTSISLLEAMGCGVCPVVTAVGGNPAVLGGALAHRLVRAADPAALAAGWRDALTNADRRRSDAGLARRRVCEAFDWKGTVRAYERLYGEA
jgi:glycosyltransferase involved in cell wall biosynthesis